MAKIFVLKFYKTREDHLNKNSFHIEEFAGEEVEAQAKAEAIKKELDAHSYKIKVRNI